MRRRLRILALTISVVTSLAFVVPLVGLLRQGQRDRTLAAATNEVRDVAFYAVTIDSPPRLQAALSTIGLPARGGLEVWYADGRAISTAGMAVGPMSESVRMALTAGPSASDPGRAYTTTGGVEILRPVALANGDRAVVRLIVPNAELGRWMTSRLVWLGAVALALVLASVVAADRVAGMKPPRPRGGTRTDSTWLTGPTGVATAD